MTMHTLAVLVDNAPGVLSRVSGLFSRRGFNIASLAVGETQEAAVSRMTIRVACDERVLDQIIQQLRKLQPVRRVALLPRDDSLGRELVLCKVRSSAQTRGEVMQIASVFRARIIDICPTAITLELTGEADKNAAFIAMMKEYGVLEIVRTGMVSLQRGEQTIDEAQVSDDDAV